MAAVPHKIYTHDVVVVGAGSAGLTAAGGCARLGLKVALVEAGSMGGECLNTGCVPSKALIAVARRAQHLRDAARFGIAAREPEVDFAAVRAHVRGAIAAIAPHDSAERFRAWGVEVIAGSAAFTAARELDVGGVRLGAPRVVLATGSKPRIPPIPGLAETPHLTNETLFELAERPSRLIILGAGALVYLSAAEVADYLDEIATLQPGNSAPVRYYSRRPVHPSRTGCTVGRSVCRRNFSREAMAHSHVVRASTTDGRGSGHNEEPEIATWRFGKADDARGAVARQRGSDGGVPREPALLGKA